LIVGGVFPPSQVVVNTNHSVITVNGEASGTIQSDLIKIGVGFDNYQIQNASNSLPQNQQRINDLKERLKQLGIPDNNIFNLGLIFQVKKKLKQELPQENMNVSNTTNTTDKNRNQTDDQKEKNLTSSSYLEIHLNNTETLARVIDLLKSLNFNINYINYDFLEDSFQYAVANLVSIAKEDAQKKANSSLNNTQYDLGQILNLNVNVNKKSNEFSENQKRQQIRVINVNVYITYALVPKAGQPLPGVLEKHKNENKPGKKDMRHKKYWN